MYWAKRNTNGLFPAEFISRLKTEKHIVVRKHQQNRTERKQSEFYIKDVPLILQITMQAATLFSTQRAPLDLIAAHQKVITRLLFMCACAWSRNKRGIAAVSRNLARGSWNDGGGGSGGVRVITAGVSVENTQLQRYFRPAWESGWRLLGEFGLLKMQQRVLFMSVITCK